MRQFIAKHSAAFILAATLTVTANAEGVPPNQAPSANATAVDLLVARPGGLAATALGAVILVVGLPFTLINGSTEQAAQKLVVEPAQYTFQRPLGENP